MADADKPEAAAGDDGPQQQPAEPRRDTHPGEPEKPPRSSANGVKMYCLPRAGGRASGQGGREARAAPVPEQVRRGRAGRVSGARKTVPFKRPEASLIPGEDPGMTSSVLSPPGPGPSPCEGRVCGGAFQSVRAHRAHCVPLDWLSTEEDLVSSTHPVMVVGRASYFVFVGFFFFLSLFVLKHRLNVWWPSFTYDIVKLLKYKSVFGKAGNATQGLVHSPGRR